jgi:hypothetical protein
MPARPLTAVVTLGVIACAATVGLEAVGVLFPSDDTGLGSRIEAFIAGLGADTETMVAPSQPVDLPEEASAREPVWLDSEPAAATGTAPAPEGVAAGEVPATAAAGEATVTAFLAMPVAPGLPAESEPDEGLSPIEILAPPWQAPTPSEQAPSEQAEPVATVPAAQTAEPAPMPSRQRVAKSDRARSARAHAGAGGATGCPVLDWLVLP